jgi:hypothetical protein
MGKKWTEFGVGIIMMASPWVLGFSDISLAKWCNVLLGLFLVIVNAWTIFGVPPAITHGEGPKKEQSKNKK